MGRTQWYNHTQFFSAQVASGVQFVDVLAAVDPEIRARATIVNIRLSYTSVQTAAQAGTWIEGVGLVVGPAGGFTVDPSVLLPSQDHSWLWTGHGYISGSAIDTYPKMVRHEANIRSARRFRGGETTLWLSRAVLLTGAGSFQAHAYVRMLLYIP